MGLVKTTQLSVTCEKLRCAILFHVIYPILRLFLIFIISSFNVQTHLYWLFPRFNGHYNPYIFIFSHLLHLFM